MSSVAAIPLGLVTGAIAGLVFFGGLLLTTRKIAESDRTVLLVVGSFLLRMAVVLAGAWATATYLGVWSIVGYLVGITLVRLFLVFRVKKEQQQEGAV
jgi:F1F0 ATPase subunit 2